MTLSVKEMNEQLGKLYGEPDYDVLKDDVYREVCEYMFSSAMCGLPVTQKRLEEILERRGST
jgi:hypothetical protein